MIQGRSNIWPELFQFHGTLLASKCVVATSVWFAFRYPLEVSIQELAQSCPIPPGQASEPDEENCRRQHKYPDDPSAEQDNSAKSNGRRRGYKSNDGATSQEQSPQCSIKGKY
jgi:hypothetical protein